MAWYLACWPPTDASTFRAPLHWWRRRGRCRLPLIALLTCPRISTDRSRMSLPPGLTESLPQVESGSEFVGRRRLDSSWRLREAASSFSVLAESGIAMFESLQDRKSVV